MLRGNGSLSEGKGSCRAGIPGKDAVEGQISGSPDRGVDAHVGHHARDDQPVGIQFPQTVEERSVPEAVGEMLDENSLSVFREDTGADIRALRSGQEKSRSRPGRNMADMNHRELPASEGGKEFGSFPARRFAPMEFHGPSGEIVVLDVNKQKDRVHKTPPTS